MARDVDALKLKKWAASGDVQTPEDAGLDRDEGWSVAFSQPGGSVPTRVVFNQMFRELSALAVEFNTLGGGLEWDASLDYPDGATVLGSDLEIYYSRAASGPASTVRDPITPANRPAFWQSLSEYIVEQAPVAGGGGGDVFGPASSINNGLAIYSGTTGKVLKASGVTIDEIKGIFLQMQNIQRTTLIQTTAIIPYDNTKPLISEGAELFSLAITPSATSSDVLIDVNVPIIAVNTANIPGIVSVFNGSDCIATGMILHSDSNDKQVAGIHIRCVDSPGVTTAVTYSVRFGGETSGGVVINGTGGDGGTSFASQIFSTASKASMTLLEISGV